MHPEGRCQGCSIDEVVRLGSEILRPLKTHQSVLNVRTAACSELSVMKEEVGVAVHAL